MQTKVLFKAALPIALLFALAVIPMCASAQTCPESCQCISEAKAKEVFGAGNYQLCQRTPCGEERSPTSGATVPKYCIKSTCPRGCTCMTEERAKLLGYRPCSDRMIPCGTDPNGKPMYCFSASSPCPSQCRCLTDAQAKEMGYKELCQNQRMECGKDAYGNARFCYKVPTYTCTGDCVCLSREEAAAKGIKENCLDASGRPVVCAIIDAEKGVYKYCFKKPAEEKCRYDYELGRCTGGCADGLKCQINTIQRDPKTGKVIYAECHCK